MKPNIYTYTLLIILLLNASCSKSDDLSQVAETIEKIELKLTEGELLRSIDLVDQTYCLNFEKSNIEVPSENISDFITQIDNWKTIIKFSNGKRIIIPTLGENLDNLIINSKVNPSGYNPLAAQVSLNLPTLGRIKLIVHAKQGANHPDIEYLFQGVEKSKVVNVLGLYPNYDNKVTLIYTDKEGKERGSSKISIKTEPLKVKYLLEPKVVVRQLDKMEEGMNLINTAGHNQADTSVPLMVDADGEIRWLLDWTNHPDLNHIAMHCGLHRMKNGNYVTGDLNNHFIVEVNVLGEIVNKWSTTPLGFSYHHEITENAAGNFLITTTQQGVKLPDNSNIRVLDHVTEFNPTSGQVERTWDFAKMLDTSRILDVYFGDFDRNYLGQSKSNWLHNNGVAEYPDGSLVCTGRWLGAFKFSKRGDLKWILAPHNQWKEAHKQYLLTPLDKSGQPILDIEVIEGRKSHPDFEWVWASHCPVIMPNGNIMIFDNGYCRNYTPNTPSQTYSRAVEYKIDEEKRTIQQVWQYGKERGQDCYAMAASGVQYLPKTGNRLFCPGTSNILSDGRDGGRVIEINPITQEVVFELELASGNETTFHRADRVSIYPSNL